MKKLAIRRKRTASRGAGGKGEARFPTLVMDVEGAFLLDDRYRKSRWGPRPRSTRRSGGSVALASIERERVSGSIGRPMQHVQEAILRRNGIGMACPCS